MAAITGLVDWVRRTRMLGRSGAAKDASLPNSLMSAPAVNRPLSPWMMMARTLASAAATS
ncbi:hypothetical protein D9M71_174010 [compost metagenome]